MNENMKALLGEELAAQVEAALKGKGKDGKDVDLVVGNDGSYVPAEKLDAERQGRISAENALKSAAAALKDIGGSGDPAKLADDVKAAQAKLGGLETAHKAELAKLRKTTALKLGLTGRAHDPEDIIQLLDLDKIDMDESGGLKKPIEELIKPIEESKPYLFVTKQEEGAPPPTVGGVKPAEPGSGGKTPPDFSKMTYGEFAAYIAAHPEAEI